MSPFFLHRFDRNQAASVIDVLIVYVADAQLNGTFLVGEVEQEIERSLPPDELVVIVRGTIFDDCKAAMANAVELAPLRERLSGKSTLTLVGYGIDGAETSRESLIDGGPSSNVSLDEIRRRGATSIFREHGGFMEANPSFHFENPSGHHTDRFMRISNILVRQAEVDFLGFCTLPWIRETYTQVYVDTPALFSVVSALNEIRASFGKARLPAENFRSYGGVDTHNFTSISSSVALISASSSGGLAAKLEARGFEAAQIVHELFLGVKGEGLNIAVNLSKSDDNPKGYAPDRRTYNREDCALCAAGSAKILLRGDQFDIAAPQPRPLKVNQEDAPNWLANQMRRFVGARALGISLRGRNGRGLYNVNTAAVLKHAALGDRLTYFIQRNVPASAALCIAIDDDSKSLCARITKEIARDIPIVGRAELENADFGSAGAIMVVAAVIESGRILLDVSRDLRNRCPTRPILYFVGVNKNSSSDHRRTLQSNLIQTDRPARHTFTTVEEFLLPPPSSSNAWEQELEFLNRTEADWDTKCRGSLKRRQTRLRNSASPLVDDVFLQNSRAKLALRLGFAFWPDGLPEQDYTQADVLFTIASVLQNLRTKGDTANEQALISGWFRQTLISPENFGRYNDGIIQASLLRSARPAEIDYRNDAEQSDLAQRIIRRILTSSQQSRGEAAAEFLIALGSRRLRIADDRLAELLKPVGASTGLVSGLLTLCRKTLLG